MGKSCGECKFFDGSNLTCMYDLRARAILDEDATASRCEYYVEGDYDEEELEKTSYK